MIRLYQHYGSAVEPQPVVVDWEPQTAQTASGEQVDIKVLPSEGQAIRRFDNLSAARSYVEEDGSAQVGGVMGVPTERLDALEHYRLVHATEAPGRSPYAQQASILAQQFGVDLRATFGESFLGALRDDFVKTFERVPGATVEGSGAAPGQEVQATVELRKPNGQTFEYTQYATADDDGNFEFTLPYSTTGYDEFGPENGYTNTSVRATGPYNVTTAATTGDDLYTTERFGQVEVTEGQVVGADDAAATVELEERIIDCPSGDPECPVDGGGGSDGGDSTNSTDAGSLIGVEPVAATTATAATAPN
jgi:dolichyl-diphosphooligosaccharide--protein glycosyltransferase